MAGYSFEELFNRGPQPLMGYLLPVVEARASLVYDDARVRLEQDLQIKSRIFTQHVGYAAGGLASRLAELAPSLPLLNVLVVRQSDLLPGAGMDEMLAKRYGSSVARIRSSDVHRGALISRAAREVYAYRQWSKVYERLFKSAPPAQELDAAGTEQDGQAVGVRSPLPESPEHLALKRYVLRHPKLIGIMGKPASAQTELRLLSGDEVDVAFDGGVRMDLVEVKSRRSNDADLLRGIYQCVKYRAVLTAQLADITPDTKVVVTLVSERPFSSAIKRLAARHQVGLVVTRVP